MKTKIQLAEFIEEVKAEVLSAAQNPKTEPFFVLNDIELEVSFNAEATAGGGFKFFIDLTGKVKASQTHTVRLKFQPRVPLVAAAGSGGATGAASPTPDGDSGPGWVTIKVDEIVHKTPKTQKGDPMIVVSPDGKFILQNPGKKFPGLNLNPGFGFLPKSD